MAGYLLDSNAIIYFFNGEKKIADLIEKTKDDLFVSFITKINPSAKRLKGYIL
jgi:predicted nucleic acid-binding protein